MDAAAVEQARKVYSLLGAYNRLPDKSRDHLIEWMGAECK